MHIDCNLYTSTVTVLDFVKELVNPGSIIIFNEWFLGDGVKIKGQKRVFEEWELRSCFKDFYESTQRKVFIFSLAQYSFATPLFPCVSDLSGVRP